MRPGISVLVAEAGPIGVLMAAAARAHGATVVVVSDPVASRRESALAHGATEAVDPAGSQFDEHFDMFIDASGAPRAIDGGLRALKAGGRAVLVGMGAARFDLDLFLVQSRELSDEGLFRYVDIWPAAIDLVASGDIVISDLVSEEFGLDGVEEAMRRNGEPGVMKFVIDPRR